MRGWVTPSHIRKEYQALCETVQKKPKCSEGETKEKPWKPFIHKTFYIPFALVATAFFVGSFGGSASLQTFAVGIFKDLNAPIDKYTATVFLGVAELVGTMICVVAIHFMGKRKLTFLSVAGTGLSFFCSAIYKFLIDAEKIHSEKYTWLPTTLMIGAAFLSHMGIRLLPWVLAGEVFPVKVRTLRIFLL